MKIKRGVRVLSREDEEFLGLGREVHRMMSECLIVAAGEPAYTNRKITFPTKPDRSEKGEVILIICNEVVANCFYAVVDQHFNVKTVAPQTGNLEPQ